MLGREIELLAKHLPGLDFSAEVKASWLSHLKYCYHLLIPTAPKASRPVFSIG